MWNTRRMRPPPEGRISMSSPRRSESFWTTMPECSSSTSMITSSMGSSRLAVVGIGREQDLRPRKGELEALAAHGLDEDAELQLAAAGDLEGVAVGGFGDADGDVALALLQQALADHPALHLVALLAGERPVVDAEHHGERRRIDRLGEERRVDRGIAQRVGDGRLRDAGDGDDVARLGEVDAGALQAAEGQHLGHAAVSISAPSRLMALMVWFGLTLPEGMRPVRMRPR